MSNFKSILPEKDAETERREQGQRKGSRRREADSRPVARSRGDDSSASPKRHTRMRSRKKNSVLPLLIGVGLIIIVMIPTIFAIFGTRRKLSEAKKIQESLEAERSAMSTSIEDLRNQLSLVNTDDFIEKYAHEKLGMVRWNEILVKMEDGTYSVNEKALQNLESSSENGASQEKAPEEKPAGAQNTTN
ncbi:MAG: septum formation initiator family protein [Peptoniphilaceae bacterium]|nr:septum formation initiator family protein [Peptoniphilaceae bacterium]MDY5766175.1 septum formation initiator family protein [Peptoniphilaceae bacterium]